MQEHSGPHIDALCHQAVEMEMFGGVRVSPDVRTPDGFTQLGAETIGPIFRRGLLLDIARSQGVDALDPGYLVTSEDLELAEKHHGVTVGEGDCVLIRTGNGRAYDDTARYLAGPGVGLDAGRWLAARKPYAVRTTSRSMSPTRSTPNSGPCRATWRSSSRPASTSWRTSTSRSWPPVASTSSCSSAFP